MFVEALEDRRLYAGTAKFIAQMFGSEEAPPRETRARGAVKFNLSRDGSTLRYRLTANRIQNVVGAHIHVGAAGANGPIAVDLMEPGGMRWGGASSSVRGTIVASELSGPLAGWRWRTWCPDDGGGTYVNVHRGDASTARHRSGDFPGGRSAGRSAGSAGSSTPPTRLP